MLPFESYKNEDRWPSFASETGRSYLRGFTYDECRDVILYDCVLFILKRSVEIKGMCILLQRRRKNSKAHTHGRRKDFFQRGGKSGFLQVVADSDNIFFCHLESKLKETFFY